jgi:uncharacterized SAM-binding protein YcdF (DUF218 family)
MFFILSKILDFLLQPILWVLLFLALGLWWRNSKIRQRFLLIAFALLVFFTNPFLINEAWLAWEIPPTPLKNMPVYDAGILLTGVTHSDKSPHDRVYFNKGADRVLHTLLLYREGKIGKIIISGGSGAILKKESTEAAELRKTLLFSGVPDSVIIVEDKSRNTRENALFTRKLLELHPEIRKTILITSAFHLRRAEGCFRKAGLQPDIFATDFYSSDRKFTPDNLIIPQENALANWNRLLHEMAGYLMYKLLGYC